MDIFRSSVLVQALQSRVAYLEAEVAYYRKKSDELTVALLRKDSHVVVKLPNVPMTAAPNVPVVQQDSPFIPERADKWSDNWMGSQTIATPPKELKVKN